MYVRCSFSWMCGGSGFYDSRYGWMRWVGGYVGLYVIVIVIMGLLDVCWPFDPLMQAISWYVAFSLVAHALLDLRGELDFIFTQVSSPS
jgi:hypothetical protein